MRVRLGVFISVAFLLVICGPVMSHAVKWPMEGFQTGGKAEEKEKTIELEDRTTRTIKTKYITGETEGDSASLNSDFGPRNVKGSEMHGGIDIDVAENQTPPVFAVLKGTVEEKRWQYKNSPGSGSGYYVKIKDEGGGSHVYGHLDFKKTFALKHIEVGYEVDEGELIGYADNTGASSGAHLDYRFYLEKDSETGKPLYINPLSLLPYCNNKIPRVEILAPEDGIHVGKEERDREVVIKTNVKAEEKDLSKLILLIHGKRAPGAEFNFEEKGRKKVAIDIKGKKYIYNKKKDKWLEATDEEEKRLGMREIRIRI